MGDPIKSKKVYKKPKRILDATRIQEEKTLKSNYGLKSMKELWTAVEELRKVRREARKLLALTEEERREREQRVLSKLKRLNIKATSLDEVLSLSVKDFLERRLQTLVFRKGLSRTLNQARQLITHGFISVDGVKQNSPGRLVIFEEEAKIAYYKKIDINKKTEEPKEEKKQQIGAEANAVPAKQEKQGSEQ